MLFFLACTAKRNPVENSEQPLSDDSLYTLVQRKTFDYFWSGAEETSGLARERYHEDGIYPENDKDVVTTGGGGFGVMAILVGIEKGFISREEGRMRLEKIIAFLEKADRFHGAWPHWLYGKTGKVKPFGTKDDGGDLVETSFMAQGLLCIRQYFKDGTSAEKNLAEKADQLWKEIDFSWYRNGKDVLYWHWSPNYGWEMNFAVQGYNECLIMYVLAAASPTHTIPAEVYHNGWADKGAILQPTESYGYKLQLKHQGSTAGGPLFWAHYSYLGLDPRGLKDRYADYWQENTSQAMINYAWCVNNAGHFTGYGPDSWGLTSSYSVKGYSGHAPAMDKDLGVIAPTAALSSMPYTPEQSKRAMRHWYHDMKDKVWGQFGFYDAFSQTAQWYPRRYLAIDQGPIVVMMENYKSGLLWNLFMSAPEVQEGLRKLGFSSPHLK
nr:glucoamylase family protein [Pedobacter sp. SYSU D00823]